MVRTVAVGGIDEGQDLTRELASSCTSESEGEGPSDNMDIPARFISPYKGLDEARGRPLLLEAGLCWGPPHS